MISSVRIDVGPLEIESVAFQPFVITCAITPECKIEEYKNFKQPSKRATTFQARLGKRLDNISRGVIDNNIRLSSHPTDMLRIEVSRDERSGDLISRKIVSSEILPIILPTLKDVPLRKFKRENNQDILIPSLYPINDQEYIEVYSPVESQLDNDDLLVRILQDSTEVDEPYVMILQVKEVLGTFGYNNLRWKKLIVTFYDEALPQKIINIIKEANRKRSVLGW